MPTEFDADVIVVGAGIVGLATARAISQAQPGVTVAIVDKEARIAAHQTGHNSGVIHSGVYYKPGSLKARTATDGRKQLVDYCRERGIENDVCGKVIVAVDDSEIDELAILEARGRLNGLAVERIGPDRLREIEPNVAGVAALWVPEAGIVDYLGVCAAMAEDVGAAGGFIELGFLVDRIERTDDAVTLHAGDRQLTARRLVNCGGLHSDRVAQLSGADPDAVIMPFRGEYFELVPERRHLIRNLVYPVPDPRFPFLGVHFTRLLDGAIHAGPNAVLALSREGYRWRDVDIGDLAQMARDPRSWRLAKRYWKTGLGEVYRSFSRRAFVMALQRLLPELTGDDLEPSPSGVRAQAVAPAGTLLDDFAISTDDRVVNVVNAPSPAATASLAIGAHIAEQLPA